jgi:hypothetical protein
MALLGVSKLVVHGVGRSLLVQVTHLAPAATRGKLNSGHPPYGSGRRTLQIKVEVQRGCNWNLWCQWLLRRFRRSKRQLSW